MNEMRININSHKEIWVVFIASGVGSNAHLTSFMIFKWMYRR